MASSEIRQLQEEDAAALAGMFASPERPAGMFERYARDHWSGSPTVLVGLKSGALAGFVTLTWNATYPPFEFASIPEIGDLSVAAGPCASEVARALMEEAERLVQERGYPRVGVSSSATQPAADRLFAERGYLPDGRGRHLTRAGPMEYLIKLFTAPALPPREPAFRYWSGWGTRLAGAYILLIALAAGFVTYRLFFSSSRTSLAGIAMVLLAYPWGRLFAGALHIHGGAGVGLVLAMSYAINTSIIYILGSAAERAFRGRTPLKSPVFRAETDG